MLAVQLKYDRMAEYLLKQGADPLLKNNEKKMASELVSNQASVYPILKNYELLFASMNNDLVSVQLIINEGGLVNFQGPNDYTALMIATEQNQVELVDYLLNIGACLLLKRIDGSTVFDLATDPLIIELLSTTKKFDEAAKEHRELNVKKLTPSFFLSMK
jgi:ankyrin repeat protein